MARRTQPKTKEEENLDKYDLNKHVAKYKNTTFFREQRDDGKYMYADRFSLIREAHMFMKHYGMGGCRSFEEYIEMVNNEDPSIVDMLIALITEDNRCEAGFKPREINLDIENYEERDSVAMSIAKFSDKSNDIAQSSVMGLISNFGGSYGDMKEKIEARRKKVGHFSHDDFSDINTTSINEPDFDLKAALSRMKTAKEQSLNIKITPQMWSGGKKHKGVFGKK